MGIPEAIVCRILMKIYYIYHTPYSIYYIPYTMYQRLYTVCAYRYLYIYTIYKARATPNANGAQKDLRGSSEFPFKESFEGM